jgi:hypothetical protein
MLTIKTSAQIATGRCLKSFRSHATATGVSLAHVDRRRRGWETLHLAVRQLRREWLHARWMNHLRQIEKKEQIR